MKKAKNTNEAKLNSIEENSEKMKVREDLINIGKQAIEYGKFKEIKGATLCAKEAFFENLFTYKLKNTVKNISFNCADRSRAVAIEAVRNLPDNCGVLYGDFMDLFKYDFDKKATAIFKKGKAKTLKNMNKHNFVWADYCAPANNKLIDDSINIINHSISKGVFAVTFCSSSRKEGGREGLLNRIGANVEIEDAENIEIVEALAKELAKKIMQGSKKKIQLIYKVIYNGGERSIMITLAFAINMPKSAFIVIDENRHLAKKEMDKERNKIFQKLRKRHGWDKPVRKKRGRKAIRKPNAELVKAQKEKESLRKKIQVRMNRGWNSEAIAQDLNKAYGYNLSAGQVGSIKAWLNPKGKLASKRVK